MIDDFFMVQQFLVYSNVGGLKFERTNTNVLFPDFPLLVKKKGKGKTTESNQTFEHRNSRLDPVRGLVFADQIV